jgi:hypothetical protein
VNGDWFDEMRAEVIDAHRRQVERRHRRTRRLQMVAVAAAVVVVAVGLGTVVSQEQVSAGVDVVRDGDDLVVRLTDLETNPSEVTEAAAEAGLDVRVDEVPVGPSMVGRFVAADGDELPPELRTVDPSGASGFGGFRVPANYQGTIRLHMGRPAEGTETWAVLSDATAPGEPLACTVLEEIDVGEVVERVRDTGAESIRVFVLDGGGEVDAGALGAAAAATPLRVMRSAADSYVVDAVLDPSTNPNPPTTPGGC